MRAAPHGACMALGVALLVLLIAPGTSSQVMQPRMRCINMPRLSPFEATLLPSGSRSSLSANVSASGALPAPNSCIAWIVTVKYSPENSSCSDSSGQLLVELFLEDPSSNVLPSGSDMRGVFLMASRQILITDTNSNGPPTVSLDASGSPVFDPTHSGAFNNQLTMTQIDERGLALHATMQRVVLPVGRQFDQVQADQNWYISLATTSPQPAELRYSLRVTCVVASQVPCPRPGRRFAECSGSGQCTRDPVRPGNEQCICHSGLTGRACGIPVTDLTYSGSSWFGFHARPQTWNFFNVTIPVSGLRPSPNAILLVEILKPAGSLSWYQPVLQLSPRLNTTLSLPTVDDIDPIRFNMNNDCTCDCDCYIPYQSELLNYEMVQVPGTSGSYSWWIGVWNQAPVGANADGSLGLLKIRARWNVTDSGPPRQLCPLDCSGRGTCARPLPGSQELGALYTCNCELGYGGPYCQGTLQISAPLSSSNPFQASMVSIKPGALHVYGVPIDGSSVASGSTTLSLAFVDSPSISPMVVVLTPVLSTSQGQLYYQPPRAFVFNSTSKVPAVFSLVNNHYMYFTRWYIAVYNSNASVSVSGSYSVTLALPTDPGQRGFDVLINKLQLGIIGAVAALIVLLLSFMTVRVLLLRRNMRRPITADLALLSLGPGGPDMHQTRSMGVPPHIAAAFPTFTYSEETFKALKHYREGGGIVNGSTGVDKPASVSAVGKGGVGAKPAAAAARVRPEEPPQPQSDGDADASTTQRTDSGELCDAPQCSVCIANFEPGEVLRQLPCLHIYHKDCIDVWMHQHDTCPNCRTKLTTHAPMQPEPSAARLAALDGGVRGTGAVAGAGATPPAPAAAQPQQGQRRHRTRAGAVHSVELPARQQGADDADCEAPATARPAAGG